MMVNLPLKLNDNHEEIKELNIMLKQLGYPVNNPTNYFDSKTQRLVIAFQNDFGIPTTGVVDDNTWHALQLKSGNYRENTLPQMVQENETNFLQQNNSNLTPEYDNFIHSSMAMPIQGSTPTQNRPILKRGSFGPNVIELQFKLIALRYLTGNADGVFGPLTYEAVRNFQKDQGLAMDGIVGPLTWTALDRAFSAVERPGPTERPIIKNGSRGEDVIVLQESLRVLGYFFGKIDGIFGNNTEEAVKNFQRDRGLVVDGVVGPLTWTALQNAITPGYTEYPIIKEGSTGESVRILQDKLKVLGYFAGSITGSFGPETTEAVKAFQANNGLIPDGIVGPLTWNKLFDLTAIPAPPPTLPPETRPTLRLGDTGDYVRMLQQELTAMMYYNQAINGIFDGATQVAVKSFQANNGLTPDGVVGRQTWFAIDSIYSPLAICS